jgi:hypothetical protein
MLWVGLQDRWDSFCLNAPNFSFMLPGLTYDGPEPDAFLPRDAVIDLFRDYALALASAVEAFEASEIAVLDTQIPLLREAIQIPTAQSPPNYSATTRHCRPISDPQRQDHRKLTTSLTA